MGRNLGPLNIKDSYEGLVQISGSQLTDGSGSLIPSLNVSVTNADNADSADTAVSASHALASDTSISSSYALSSSFATTASFALNVTPPETGSFMITGSVTDDTLTFTKGDATTFDLVVDNVDNSNTASLVSTDEGDARSGIHYIPFVDVRNSDGQQLFTNVDLQYNPATDTIKSDLQGTASYATTSQTSSVVALTAASTSQNFGIPLVESTDVGTTTGLRLSSENSLLFNPGLNVFTFADDQNVIITGDLNVSGNITGSNASFQTASIGYLRTVTGSATIIGDEFIILNADTPAARYAGLKVYDSGSGTPATASFEWDGLSDNWILVEESGNSGVLLTGPTGSKGSEVLPTVNTIQKGGGHHTLIDSNITDNGSSVNVSSPLTASAFSGDGSGLTNTGELSKSGSTYFTDDGQTVNYVKGVVIGEDSTSESDNAVAIGGGTISTTANYSVAIGTDADVEAGAEDAVVIGRQAGATGGDHIVAIGFGADGTSTSAVAIGENADAAFAAVAIGASARGQGSNTVSIGRSCQSSAQDSIGIGQRANRDSAATGASALGSFTDADNAYGTALGYGAQATGSLAMEFRVNQLPIMSTPTTSQEVTFYADIQADQGITVGGTLDAQGVVKQSVSALSIAANVAELDASTGNMFTLTLQNGVDTELQLSNQSAGQTFQVQITNNATSPGTISFDSQFLFEGGTAFTATASTSAVDVLTFTCFAGGDVVCVSAANFS